MVFHSLCVMQFFAISFLLGRMSVVSHLVSNRILFLTFKKMRLYLIFFLPYNLTCIQQYDCSFSVSCNFVRFELKSRAFDCFQWIVCFVALSINSKCLSHITCSVHTLIAILQRIHLKFTISAFNSCITIKLLKQFTSTNLNWKLNC